MRRGWWREIPNLGPDLTTQAIIRIDSELAETERLHRDVMCFTCGKSGIHTHTYGHSWLPDNNVNGLDLTSSTTEGKTTND